MLHERAFVKVVIALVLGMPSLGQLVREVLLGDVVMSNGLNGPTGLNHLAEVRSFQPDF